MRDPQDATEVPAEGCAARRDRRVLLSPCDGSRNKQHAGKMVSALEEVLAPPAEGSPNADIQHTAYPRNYRYRQLGTNRASCLHPCSRS
jgi:hypothetical protein